MDLLDLSHDGGRAHVVEELLRRYSIVITFRYITRDFDFHGAKLKAGERVAMLLPTGNMDPVLFPNPEKFDIDRENKVHMAFNAVPQLAGGGIPQQDVAVPQKGAAVERDCDFESTRRLLSKTVLLRFPVVEREDVNDAGGELAGPLGIGLVADDATGEALQAQLASAGDPMQQSFVALMLAYASATPIDMTAMLKTFCVELRTVEAYARRVMV